MLLLFDGIHNAWDGVAYHLFTKNSNLRNRRVASAFATNDEHHLNSFSAEYLTQFVFGTFENALAFFRKIFAGAVDVEVQHRHGGLIWFRFATFAAFR